MSYLPIEETDLFRKTEELVDAVWDLVESWTTFRQDTVGKQLVRAADSIGANLVEGDGRYGDAESIHFFVIARASARETGYWLRRCKSRKLIEAGLAADLIDHLTLIQKSLNGLINYRRKASKPTAATQRSTPNAKRLSAAQDGGDN